MATVILPTKFVKGADGFYYGSTSDGLYYVRIGVITAVPGANTIQTQANFELEVGPEDFPINLV